MNQLSDKIRKANDEAIKRLSGSTGILKDIARAKDVIPGMKPELILHAGPPVEWSRMCGPVKGAVMGALVYEGLASTIDEARELAGSGKIEFSPCHHHCTVGPMAGVVSSSMYVFCISNEPYGNQAYCTLNEGLGKVLRFGAYGEEVIKRLKWIENSLAPSLKEAVNISGGINVKNMTGQALQMGDECHNRNMAATNLFLKEITPHLLRTGLKKEAISEIFSFISGNPHFYLNLSMASCKAAADTILGLEYSTIVSAMARNGTEIGIRIAGLDKEWFTAPSGQPKGLYFAGFSESDGNPDLGDSTISEVAGIGAFAMASAPAIVKFVGGEPEDAIRYTKQMYEICYARHSDFQIPALGFAGTPLGVDIRKVVETGVTPIINTGIAHKEPGIGQIGAGILNAPLKMFEDAIVAFGERYKD